MGEIESNQIVAEQERRTVCERIQLRQRRRRVPARKDQAPAGIGTQRSEGVNAAVPDADFEVQR